MDLGTGSAMEDGRATRWRRGGHEVRPGDAAELDVVIVTTDDKRLFLRSWALQLAAGDASKLPAIREAREAVKRHFGDGPGMGLGTDIVTKDLRAIREELLANRLPPLPVPVDQMTRVAQIAALLKAEGLQSLTIDADGLVMEMKRFVAKP